MPRRVPILALALLVGRAAAARDGAAESRGGETLRPESSLLDRNTAAAASFPATWLQRLMTPVRTHVGRRANTYVSFVKCTQAGSEAGRAALKEQPYSDEASRQRLKRAGSLMKEKLDGPEFPKVIDVVDDTEQKRVWLLTEDMGSNLVDHLPRSDLKTKGRWLTEAMAGIAKMHAKGLVHGDLQPRNIQFTGPKPSVPTQDEYHAVVGNPNFGEDLAEDDLLDADDLRYTPSEAFENPESEASEKEDIWAMGLVYYEMLFGKLPKPIRSASDVMELKEALKNFDIEDDPNFVKLQLHQLDGAPEGVNKQILCWWSQDFLYWTLQADPARRYSAETALATAEKIASELDNTGVDEALQKRVRSYGACIMNRF